MHFYLFCHITLSTALNFVGALFLPKFRPYRDLDTATARLHRVVLFSHNNII